jgi:osmotically-inducible protein OsmY
MKTPVPATVLLVAGLSAAACNYAYSDKDADASSGTAPAPSGESAVATSGTRDAGPWLDDGVVTSRIQAKFFLDPGIKMRRIDVDTEAGVVTLRGEVASENERAQALILARTTEGVERVEDALTVNASLATPIEPAAPPDVTGSGSAPTPAHADDESLTALIQSRFNADSSLGSATIAVTAKDGVVLLDGMVPTAAARQQALTLARETPGVLQVIDRIAITRTK